MEINQMKHFLAVAKYQNMNKAASELRISQPALSQSIARLEDDMGVKVFDRVGKRLVINDNGKKLKILSESIVNEVELFYYNLRESNMESISIISNNRYFETFVLPNYFIANVHEHITTRITDIHTLSGEFLDGYADVAVCDVDFSKKSRNIESIHIMDNHTFASIPISNPLSSKKTVTLSDFTDQPIIREVDVNHPYPLFSSLLEKGNPSINVVYSGNREAIDIIKRKSNYIYFMSTFRLLYSDMQNGRCFPRLEGDFFSWPVYLSFRKNTKNKNVAAFAYWISDYLKKEIANNPVLSQYDIHTAED